MTVAAPVAPHLHAPRRTTYSTYSTLFARWRRALRGDGVACVTSALSVVVRAGEARPPVNTALLIDVKCVSPVAARRSMLAVWISWQLPPSHDDDARWHSIIDVHAVDRRTRRLDFIAETDSDHKRLDLPANQLFDIRVGLCLHALYTSTRFLSSRPSANLDKLYAYLNYRVPPHTPL